MTPKILPLKDQVVLLTDASRGLGRAIALAFARQGVLGLVINCLTHSEYLDDLLTQVNLHATRVVVVKADVTNANDIEHVFETSKRNFGYPITTVVNNSLTHSGSSDEYRTLDVLGWDAFELQLRGGLQGALNTTKAALVGMRDIGFGRIINISVGAIPSHETMASRSTMLALTHTAAAELCVSNITVNLINCTLPRQMDPKGDIVPKAQPHKSTCMEEVADAVLFFASPWARGVTGQNIFVGGRCDSA